VNDFSRYPMTVVSGCRNYSHIIDGISMYLKILLCHLGIKTFYNNR